MSLNVYAFGGSGINIGKGLDSLGVEADYVAVDTSDANTRQWDHPILRPQGVKGSGKVRATNHHHVSPLIQELLMDHPPGDFNVVIFGAGGGTGGIFAPELLKELAEKDADTLAVVITAEEDGQSIENCQKTLRNIARIAQQTGKSIPMIPSHNSPGVSLGEINSHLVNLISLVVNLVANIKGIDHLDEKDLSNWMYPETATNFTPQPVHITVPLIGEGENHTTAEKLNAITTLSIYKDINQPMQNFNVHYSTHGFADPKEILKVDKDAIHLATSTHIFRDLMDRLESRSMEISKASKVNRTAVASAFADVDGEMEI